MPLVSIVMPVYNAEKFIKQTLESVINQTFDDWELLIVDDCSSDSSASIIKEFILLNNNIKYFKQDSNQGSAAARNKGLGYANSKFIAFLDADDLWDDTFLDEQFKFIKEKSADIVFSSYRRINENGDVSHIDFIVPEKVEYHDLLKTCSMSCLTSIYNAEKLGKFYFDSKLGSLRDDFVMWLSILKNGHVAYGNTKILASYRVFSSSTSANKFKMLPKHFNVLRNVEKLGFLKSIYYISFWAINGFLKYRK